MTRAALSTLLGATFVAVVVLATFRPPPTLIVWSLAGRLLPRCPGVVP